MSKAELFAHCERQADKSIAWRSEQTAKEEVLLPQHGGGGFFFVLFAALLSKFIQFVRARHTQSIVRLCRIARTVVVVVVVLLVD